MANIFGDGTSEFISGAAGNDSIFARGGNDTVRGRAGNDIIRGEAGNDVLVGDTGSDTIFGGWGNDRMIWNNGDGSDLMEGGSGHDVVEVNGSTSDGDVFTINPNGARVDFDRTNLVPFSLDIGTTERLEVNGLGGNDTITGAAGLAGLIALRLDGGGGHDRITGGDGNDAILGGWGNDTLTGLDGADTFVFTRGKDLVTDFENGVDRIEIRGIAGIDDFSDLTGLIQAEGSDVTIDFGWNELTLANTAPDEFDPSDFLFG